jgi:hypothetical protein
MVLVRRIGLQQGLGIPAADLVLPEREQHEPLVVRIGPQAVEEQGMQVFGPRAGRDADHEDRWDRSGQFVELGHHGGQCFGRRRPVGALARCVKPVARVIRRLLVADPPRRALVERDPRPLPRQEDWRRSHQLDDVGVPVLARGIAARFPTRDNAPSSVH